MLLHSILGIYITFFIPVSAAEDISRLSLPASSIVDDKREKIGNLTYQREPSSGYNPASEFPDSREGELCIYFIPRIQNDDNFVYVYDNEKKRLLVYSNGLPKSQTSSDMTSEPREWIVLPGNVRAYTSPSIDSEPSSIVLGYPQKIESISTIYTKQDSTEWIEFIHEGTCVYLPLALLTEQVKSPCRGNTNLPIGEEVVDHNTPLPLEYKPSDLVTVNQKWNFHGRDYPKYLRVEAVKAVEIMLTEAEKQGIHIRIFSAFRSSEKQRYLYLQKLEEAGWNQNMVAKSGHSEHQLGTAVDLCGLNPKSVANRLFGATSEGDWLLENANLYGFRLSYTAENTAETGYGSEPWHYRYMGNLSRQSHIGK